MENKKTMILNEADMEREEQFRVAHDLTIYEERIAALIREIFFAIKYHKDDKFIMDFAYDCELRINQISAFSHKLLMKVKYYDDPAEKPKPKFYVVTNIKRDLEYYLLTVDMILKRADEHDNWIQFRNHAFIGGEVHPRYRKPSEQTDVREVAYVMEFMRKFVTFEPVIVS